MSPRVLKCFLKNQFFRFLLVGLANTALGYAFIFGCMYLVGLTPELSNTIGYSLGFLFSYSLNRKFTFRSAQQRSSEFFRFGLVFLLAYMANFTVLIVLIRLLGFDPAPSQICSGVFYVGTAYALNKLYVFKKTCRCRSSKGGMPC